MRRVLGVAYCVLGIGVLCLPAACMSEKHECVYECCCWCRAQFCFMRIFFGVFS